MPSSDIKKFIDFFHDASIKIRREKPIIQRGRDGMLVKKALNFFSRQHLEMLAVWFLGRKPKIQPKISAMLSKKIMEELEMKIKSPDFWKDLDDLTEKYYK